MLNSSPRGLFSSVLKEPRVVRKIVEEAMDDGDQPLTSRPLDRRQ
jgi:hypothetical protein